MRMVSLGTVSMGMVSMGMVEGVYGCHWCQNGGDDILKGAILEELLIETVACLSDFCLLEEMGIQVDVTCEDGGNLWISWA